MDSYTGEISSSTSIPGGKGGPGEGAGNGFLRRKAEKRGMDGLIVFIIPKLLPVSRRENVTLIVSLRRLRARESTVTDNTDYQWEIS